MKKLRTWLRRERWFVILASLVVAATLAMWHRSRATVDELIILAPTRKISLFSSHGGIGSEIEFRASERWGLDFRSEPDSAFLNWPFSWYKRYVFALSIGTGYWVILSAEILLLILLLKGKSWFRYRRKRRTRPV